LPPKTFVLDTNVPLHNADCVDSSADNAVVSKDINARVKADALALAAIAVECL
jgi:predicted ribonuclease YlaK